jgi:hypothetical protein
MKPGDVISYIEMCQEEGVNLQRGMNYELKPNYSVILMSVRPGAPYYDKFEEDGKILIYEGHDVYRKGREQNPKSLDQPMFNPGGSLTQNGLFFNAAKEYKEGKRKVELAKVYEKIRSGVWVYNGIFRLIDAWNEEEDGRKVFKFRLEITDESLENKQVKELEHNRIIPSSVKLEVWKRDKGKCIICGSTDNLHFDHIIPYSKGGSSLVADNIQLLCARHNLEKKDRIG